MRRSLIPLFTFLTKIENVSVDSINVFARMVRINEDDTESISYDVEDIINSNIIITIVIQDYRCCNQIKEYVRSYLCMFH